MVTFQTECWKQKTGVGGNWREPLRLCKTEKRGKSQVRQKLKNTTLSPFQPKKLLQLGAETDISEIHSENFGTDKAKEYGLDDSEFVQYIHVDRNIEQPPQRITPAAGKNVRHLEYDYMQNLESLNKKSAKNKHLTAKQIVLESVEPLLIPDGYLRFHTRVLMRLRKVFFDGKMVVPERLSKWLLNFLPLGQPRRTKTLCNAITFWWRGCRKMFERNQKLHRPHKRRWDLQKKNTKNSRKQIELEKLSGEWLLGFRWKLYNKKLGAISKFY